MISASNTCVNVLVHVWFALALACSLPRTSRAQQPATHADSQSDGRAQASAHFQRGIEHADAGDYARALAEFEHAHALQPHPSVLYNIGLALVALDRPVRAVQVLRAYLEQSGDQAPQDQRARAQAQLEKLLPRVALVNFVVEPAQARVTVDGQEIDPRNEQVLSRSQHNVEVTAPEHVPLSRSLDLRGQTKLTVALSLRRLMVLAADEPSSEAALPPLAASDAALGTRGATSDLRIWGLASGLVGLGLGGAALAVFAWNDGRHHTWQREQDQLVPLVEQTRVRNLALEERLHAHNDLLRAIKTWDAVDVTLGISGGVLLLVGTGLWLAEALDTHPSEHSRRAALTWHF